MPMPPGFGRFAAIHREFKAVLDRYGDQFVAAGLDRPVRSVNVVETTNDNDLSGLIDQLDESHCPRIEIVQGAGSMPTIRPNSGPVIVKQTYVLWATTCRVRVSQLQTIKEFIIGALLAGQQADESRPVLRRNKGLFGLPYVTDVTATWADRTSGDLTLGPETVIIRGSLSAQSVLALNTSFHLTPGDFALPSTTD